ncbi:MAG TPA: SDR family NAD(P)-dependent oxidoreductase [Rhodospirillales bacterium]|nr:SDR family NAD(P)-dependent oxidoreductase [Rhodospirillales bacterium]HIL74404.1 SDR family NAD(P)-dependent oxidoreductase [Rhodospirillales bacterium]
MSKFRSILITGASSGIGRALAKGLAGPGIFLAISGRTASDLHKVSKQCQARGAAVIEKIVDVTDQSAMKNWIEEIDDTQPLDLVIANAGVSTSTSGEVEKSLQQRRMLDINVFGVLNTIEPILPRMAIRQTGSIALMSSLAGFNGMPSAPGYSASKAWVRSYGEGLRGKFLSEGIRISVVCPGFVKSRITQQNTFTMPFLMDAQLAANIILKGLEKDKVRIAFPLSLYAAILFLSVLPSRLTNRLVSYFPRKE